MPGLLLVPSAQTGAHGALRAADRLAARAMNVVVVSLPGSGASSGPDDLGGPLTQAALRAGYDSLIAIKGVDPTRVAIWGTREGAAPAILFAAEHPEIRAVIAEGGDYDPWASYRAADPGKRADIVTRAGTDSAGWRSRSALASASRIQASVLLLHAEDDPHAPASAAHALEAALSGHARDVSVHFVAQGDRVPEREVTRESRAFLDRVLAR